MKKIPDGWEDAKISKQFLLQGGYAFKSADNTLNGAKWLKIANVGFGTIKWLEQNYLPLSYLETYSEFCLNKDDIVIAMTRPLLNGILKVAKVSSKDSPALLNQRVARLIPKKSITNAFLFHILKTKHLSYKLESDLLGTDPPNLSVKTFGRISIRLPPLPEQKAIADILSTWDEAIEKTERLIKVKERCFNGLLRSLICEKKDWRKVMLGEVCIPLSLKNTENETNVLTSSAQFGLVSQTEYYNKSVCAENITGYYLLQKGDFAYNRSSSKGYPYGATKRLDKYDKGVLSTLYLCFSLKKDISYFSNFLLHLFESGFLNRELRYVCQEGARSHGLLNITKSDFFSIKIPLPPLEEQKQIASVLNTAQDEIAILKTMLEKYKKQKKGLMQKLLVGDWRVRGEIVKGYEEEV